VGLLAFSKLPGRGFFLLSFFFALDHQRKSVAEGKAYLSGDCRLSLLLICSLIQREKKFNSGQKRPVCHQKNTN